MRDEFDLVELLTWNGGSISVRATCYGDMSEAYNSCLFNASQTMEKALILGLSERTNPIVNHG